jgi:anti-sigma regulatory factor (Ser/Thr protein kinase)
MIRQFDCTSDFSDVAAARRFVRSSLADVSADVVADLQLIVSELMTNAIEHGSCSDVTVELGVDDREIVLSVTSRGEGEIPPVAEWVAAPADALAGRGLAIVRELASHVWVTRDGDLSTVHVVRGL